MEKTAQKMRWLTKKREQLNAPTEKLMGLYSPQFVELMDKLREVDDSVREEAAPLKDLLKVARTNFNRREYMTAISFLGQFNDKMSKITDKLSELKKDVQKAHNEFLFSDIDQEHIKYLTEQMAPKFKKKQVKKQAGITDWWHNLTDDRGKALKAWEKRFPKQIKQLKQHTASMIIKSESLYSNLISALKALASFRATRKLEDYLKLAEKLDQKYKSYNATFSEFYNSYVAPFVELQQEKQNIPTAIPQELKDHFQKELDLAKEHVVPEGSPPFAKQPFKLELREPSLSPEKTKEEKSSSFKGLNVLKGLDSENENTKTMQEPAPYILDEAPDESPDTTRPEDMTKPSLLSPLSKKEKPIKVEMANDANELIEKLSTINNTFEMATEIILYAHKVQEEKPEISKQLLNISTKLLAE